MNIDVEKLRQDLIDYYEGIMFNVSPAAMIELEKVKRATDEEIIAIASSIGFNLDNYTVKKII